MATKSMHVFAALVLVSLSFAILEILTRVVFRNKQFDTELLYSNGNLETFSEELGWSLNPGVVQRIRTTDNQVVTYRTNSYGFRTFSTGEGRESENNPAVAVLFVGDSITFGTSANTSYPEEFSNISHLRSINAGVPGYGTDQAFLMTTMVMETYRIHPKFVVYGFYWNDIQNNISERSIHGEAAVLIHKPVLDLDTNEYRKAERSKNDVTAQYAAPDGVQAFLILASQSKFLRAAGRVVKYDAPALLHGTPLFQFDELAQNYLKGNLDHFEAYLRARSTKFVVLHVAGGRPDLERQLTTYLQAYCQARSILYVHPQLGAVDFLRTDPHLSEQGARQVAAALWHELR